MQISRRTIRLDGDDLAAAIDAYLTAHSIRAIRTSGSMTVSMSGGPRRSVRDAEVEIRVDRDADLEEDLEEDLSRATSLASLEGVVGQVLRETSPRARVRATALATRALLDAVPAAIGGAGTAGTSEEIHRLRGILRVIESRLDLIEVTRSR